MQPGVTIVSNRLPVSVKRVDGVLEFYPSVGGLATGLSSYANNRRNKWVGWPGIASDDLSEQDRIDITNQLRKHNCYPVFLTQKQLDDYYNGFSNSVLWPAFHELPVNDDIPSSYWEAYKRVNKIFAEAVLALSPSGSTIWVHDYQLLLVPGMIRNQRPNDTIGFFLHIPFPTAENFLAIPHAQRLLAELTGGNLVGFHTASYVQNFLDSCQQADIGIIGQHKLILPDRVVRVTDFPMGIDFAKFARATRAWSVKLELLKLRLKYRGKRVILTVDRLDPTKGLVGRLQAYRTLLKQNPELHGKVVMTMLAVPSRTEIAEYKALKQKLEKLVKTVNKEFGSLAWQPVDYMYKSVPFSQLTALYRRADVAFIAPIKDGMNLVAKEYLASQRDSRGILILSKTAGAAEELKDAIIVNPEQKKSLVYGLKRALSAPRKDLRRRASRMQDHIAKFTVHDWAGNFMKALKQAPHAANSNKTLTWQLTASRRRELLTEYRQSQHRVVLLDYDGVLVSFRGKPADAEPAKATLSKLERLSQQPDTHLIIISGRPKDDLQTWLGHLNHTTLVAEHGAFIRRRNTKRWRVVHGADLSWKSEAQDILEKYSQKTPGAFIEAKEAALVWHYRRAHPYYAHKHLVILKRLLRRLAKDHPVVVEQGNMILEIRLSDVHKGTVALEQLEKNTDFILAVGDDVTDEDMFEHLPTWAYTVKVGRGRTAARFRLSNIEAVHDLLTRLLR